MTDLHVLAKYRMKQAEETLADAKKMVEGNFTSRSITNRAYYSAFYATLALFLYADVKIKTSKHAGIIGILDKEFIHSTKIDVKYSKILHKLFEVRQEGDYKELVSITNEKAASYTVAAEEFIIAIKNFINPEK